VEGKETPRGERDSVTFGKYHTTEIRELRNKMGVLFGEQKNVEWLGSRGKWNIRAWK